MSFLSRFQPLALSGFLALTATSCPPDRLWSAFRGQPGDEANDPFSCPVRDLPPVADGPRGLGLGLEALSERGIAPETFHSENLDRFRMLAPICSPPQLQRYAQFQDVLAERLNAMVPAEIAVTLEGYYRQAYVYDAASRTMALGTTPAHREAKQRLDLWTAAIDHRAFGDEAFNRRMREESRIRVVTALNSPHLDPVDRGWLERVFRAEPQGEAALYAALADRPLEGYERLFDWLRSYDGRNEKFFENPLWRSVGEVFEATDAHFGRERFLRMNQRVFAREAILRFIDERGYGASYRNLSGLETEALVRHYHEVSMAIASARPNSRRRLVEEVCLMGVVFDERGVDPTAELRRRGVDEMIRMGYDPHDAALMDELQAGLAHYTHTRLDDYRGRHGLLNEYRSVYRELVTRPLEEAFSRSNRTRYAMWGNFILNRSVMNMPILLEDLDRIRWEVANEVIGSLRLGRGGGAFELRDTDTPQWFTPGDLGLCHSMTGGPLVVAGLAWYNGQTANDLICNNVELMAFLPDDLEVEHALATAIGVFGVITVRNSDTASVGGRAEHVAWAPGALLETLTHEASHIDWFRENFDRDSHRLPMLALNERRAYATGGGYLADYALSGLGRPEETEHLDDRLEFANLVVDAANRTLGVSRAAPQRMEPDYWEPVWDSEPLGRFVFQPPDVLIGERQRRMLESRFGSPTQIEISGRWSRLFLEALEGLRLSRSEKNEALLALDTLESTANGVDAGFYFLQSHPLTRTVNAVVARLGLNPFPLIDMSASDWDAFKSGIARRSIDMEHLYPPARPPRRR